MGVVLDMLDDPIEDLRRLDVRIPVNREGLDARLVLLRIVDDLKVVLANLVDRQTRF
jgi:hypothetical protein